MTAEWINTYANTYAKYHLKVLTSGIGMLSLTTQFAEDICCIWTGAQRIRSLLFSCHGLGLQEFLNYLTIQGYALV